MIGQRGPREAPDRLLSLACEAPTTSHPSPRPHPAYSTPRNLATDRSLLVELRLVSLPLTRGQRYRRLTTHSPSIAMSLRGGDGGGGGAKRRRESDHDKVEAALRGVEPGSLVPVAKKAKCQAQWAFLTDGSAEYAATRTQSRIQSTRTARTCGDTPPAHGTKLNVGMVCFFCSRTHEARFKCNNWSVKTLVTKLGVDEEVHSG